MEKHRADSRAVYSGSVDSSRGVLDGLHILVAEDDRDNREILKSILGYFGALVTVTQGVDDAAAMLRQVAPDVVLADMMLGAGTGFRLVERARRRGSPVPFIAISGQDFNADELEAAGFAAYLRKPLDHQKLIDTILAVVRNR